MNLLYYFRKNSGEKNIKNNIAKRTSLTLNPKYLDSIQPAKTGLIAIEKMKRRNITTNPGKYSDLSQKKINEINRILLHLEREYML